MAPVVACHATASGRCSDPVAQLPVADAYRAMGWPMQAYEADGHAGYGDCVLPAQEHGDGSRDGTVRIYGSKWECRTCRNRGDTADLLAFFAGRSTYPFDESAALEELLRQRVHGGPR